MAQLNNIENMARKFISKLLLSNKIDQVYAKMKPKHTTEEMFAYFWSLDEAHETLTPVLHPENKSKEESCEHCRQGDIRYRLYDLDQALRCYNLAILSAPHPDTFTDNVKTLGKNMPEELAQAYESRSALLFDMKQYKKCLDDINRALELGCVQSRRKLLDRKSICLKFISEGKDKAFDASAEAINSYEPSFAYVYPEPPKCADHNPAMPSFSSAVKLAYTHSHGRHLIADRDINPGEIVSVEDGYCSSIGYCSKVFSEEFLMYCTVCMRRCMAPLPCPNCKLVIFCSEECRSLEFSGIHWQECPIVSTLRVLDIANLTTLACRLMMKTSHAKLREMIPLLRHEAKNQPPKNLGFNQNGIYDTSDYRSVYHLTTNKEKLSSQELLTRCAEAFIATKLLQLSGRYFVSCYGEPFTPSHEDIILTGSTLFHHMMSLYCNTISFGAAMYNVNVKKYQLEVCAAGIFPAASLMNHSCNPNCCLFYYGKTVVVRAMQFIPAGKTLTITYCEDFTENRDSRLAKIKYYHFTCTCEACENNWPTCMAFTKFEILKCTNCNEGEGINPLTKVCPNCHLNYDQGGMQGRAPYNYKLICRKILEVQKDFFIAKKNIVYEGSNSEKDIKVVRALIKLFCKYVKQPSSVLFNAQDTLCFVCLRRSSCVYVKHDIETTMVNQLRAHFVQALLLDH